MRVLSVLLMLVALVDCRGATTATPKRDQAEAPERVVAGLHAWRAGDVKTAISDLESAHARDPRALAVLARAWLAVGNGEKARAAGAAALAAAEHAGARATPRFVADLGEGVEHVAASSDGVLVATTTPSQAGRKPATTIWDTTIGRDRYRLADTQVAAFGGNGLLATIHSNGLVDVHDAATGHAIREFAPRIGAPVWIGFAPDNTLVAIDNTSIHEWDATSGRALRTYATPKGFRPDKSAFALSADGALLVGAIRTGLATGDACAIWSRRDPTPKATVVPLGTWVVGGLAIARDGRIAIGVRARPLTKIVLVDGPHAKIVGELPTADEARVLGFRPDGDLVAVGHDLQRWHGTQSLQKVALPHDVGRGHGVLVADASVLVAANDSVALIDATGEEAGKAWAIAGRAEAVLALAWSPDGTRLAVGGSSPRVTVWDVVRGGRPTMYDAGDAVSAVAIDRDGRVAASLHQATSHVIVWNAAGARERELEAHELGSLAFEDGGGLVGRELDDARVVHAWSAAGQEIDASARAVPGRTFAVSPDRTRIAEASDQRIIIRALDNGGKIVGIVQVGDQPTALAWGATALAAVHHDGRISCYNHETGDAVRTLSDPGATGAITLLAFRPDGHTLAVGRLDGIVDLWDMPSQSRIAQLAPSRDGHWLVLAADGSTDGEPGVASTLTFEADGITLPWVTAWDRHAKPGLLAAVVAKPPPAIVIPPVRPAVEPPPSCLPHANTGPIVSATPSTDGNTASACWLRDPDQHAMCFDVDLPSGRVTPVPPDLETQDAASHWGQPAEPATPAATWDDDHTEAKVCGLAAGSPCHTFRGTAIAVTSDHALVAVRTDPKSVEIWDLASNKRLARHPIPVRHDAHSAIGFWSHTLLVSAESCVGPCETSVAYDTRTGRRLGPVGSAAHPATTSDFAPVLLHDDVWAFHEDHGGGAIVIQDATTAQVIARVSAKELGVDAKALRGPVSELRATHDGGVIAIGAAEIAGRVWTLDRRGAMTHTWRVPTCAANP